MSVATGIDALRVFHSGAVADGLPQVDAAACLGGLRSSTEAAALGVLVDVRQNYMPALVIERVTGTCGEGVAEVRATGDDSVRWAPPNFAVGSAVTIEAYGRAVAPANTAGGRSHAVRLRRDTAYSAKALAGTLRLDLAKPYNNAVGGANIANAARAAGQSDYRALILQNASDLTITDLRFRVKPLVATAQVSGAGQLGASGSGTIETAGSFAAWPVCGFARVEQSGGTLREIVYYTDRTDTVLVVPAAGREMLGTTAAAGASDDNVYSVPGIALAIEAPVSGAIQEIADDTTSPTSVTWSTSIALASGPSVASLTSGGTYGLWIHRQTPAGATASPRMEIALEFDFTWSGNSYAESMYGLYRVEDTTLPSNLMHVGVDADPDYDAAADDTGALPLVYTVTPPGAGTQEHRVIVRTQNPYGLLSLNRYLRTVTVDDAGDIVTPDPSDPYDVQAVNIGTGRISLRANYSTFGDVSNAADQWAIYIRGDGVNPDPNTDTPTLVSMSAAPIGQGPVMGLLTTLGPYPKRMPIKILVRSRKQSTGAESTNTTPVSLTVNSIADGSAWQPRVFLGRSNAVGFAGESILTDTVINEANNIFLRRRNGASELWNDTQLVWRWRYDSIDTERNGFWTTFSRVAGSVSGAAVGSGVIEYVDANTLYVPVNGVRRMKIDLATSEITIPARTVDESLVYLSHAAEAIHDATWAKLFQVYDQATNNYVTAGHLDVDGRLYMAVGWKTRSTEAEL